MKGDELTGRLESIAAQLRAELPDEINFDHLAELLDTAAGAVGAAERADRENALLREDLSGRIAGMTKAIAVAERNPDRLAEALALIDQLPAMTAEDLLSLCARVQARFRDTFRCSFPSADRSLRSVVRK